MSGPVGKVIGELEDFASSIGESEDFASATGIVVIGSQDYSDWEEEVEVVETRLFFSGYTGKAQALRFTLKDEYGQRRVVYANIRDGGLRADEDTPPKP